MQSHQSTRLQATLEADPGALVRVLQQFQARNVVPLHVSARRVDPDTIHVEIDIDAAELPADALRAVAAKLAESPVVVAVDGCW